MIIVEGLSNFLGPTGKSVYTLRDFVRHAGARCGRCATPHPIKNSSTWNDGIARAPCFFGRLLVFNCKAWPFNFYEERVVNSKYISMFNICCKLNLIFISCMLFFFPVHIIWNGYWDEERRWKQGWINWLLVAWRDLNSWFDISRRSSKVQVSASQLQPQNNLHLRYVGLCFLWGILVFQLLKSHSLFYFLWDLLVSCLMR